MTNQIEFEDIVSKPVGTTGEKIQTLGIYCWQMNVKVKNSAYFLPRFSLDKNKDYLESLYPGISNDKNLQGKGIFASVWRIARTYNKVMPDSPEDILWQDYHTLSVFKAWKSFTPEDYENGVQVYVLEEEKRFPLYKYTATQNPSGIVYYDWDTLLAGRVL